MCHLFWIQYVVMPITEHVFLLIQSTEGKTDSGGAVGAADGSVGNAGGGTVGGDADGAAGSAAGGGAIGDAPGVAVGGAVADAAVAEDDGVEEEISSVVSPVWSDDGMESLDFPNLPGYDVV